MKSKSVYSKSKKNGKSKTKNYPSQLTLGEMSEILRSRDSELNISMTETKDAYLLL